ncbi:hypothetical protein PSMK_p00170 (plasmid) [Phycisphaera mikurensis NBRC 102666]|uniref:Uncharacterized protein n=1 Tax=Phycisphaera mikurensis (strain NBRC 102666 / KCTC 22515 / FYK2301M01) TaxID=1142394 RepID=I0IJE1_PHYMF|nr:hypothetical protein PSMK_p00170 [Phycisphaera mikurensis NBRC 102666]
MIGRRGLNLTRLLRAGWAKKRLRRPARAGRSTTRWRGAPGKGHQLQPRPCGLQDRPTVKAHDAWIVKAGPSSGWAVRSASGRSLCPRHVTTRERFEVDRRVALHEPAG